MAITSVGYAGTVGDAQWAEMISRVGGAVYSVDTYGSFRVTASAGTRTVSIAAGGASGKGIYDENPAAITQALASVPSGTRWDLIVLRRTWATKVTAVAVVQGGSTKAIPTRTVTPGTVDDQPLALVRVAAGSNAIQEIVDLRCAVSNGGAVAWDALVRSYLNELGTSVRIGDVVWDRVTDGSGSPEWVTIASPWATIAHISTVKNSGGSFPLSSRPLNPGVLLRGVCQHKTAAFGVSQVIAVLPIGVRPQSMVRYRVSCSGGSGSGGSGNEAAIELRSDGNVVLMSWSGGSAPTWVSLDGVIIPND